MRIREGRIGEEKSIANVIINTWKYAYQGLIDQGFLDILTTEKHEALFKEQLEQEPYVVHVLVTEEDHIVGMVSGGSDSSGKYDCEIVAIYIEKEYQKSGFGRELLLKNVERYEEMGYKSMIVWTLEKNKDREFYKKMGGEIREKETITIGTDELTLVGFVWDDIHKIISE